MNSHGLDPHFSIFADKKTDFLKPLDFCFWSTEFPLSTISGFFVADAMQCGLQRGKLLFFFWLDYIMAK